MFPPDPDVPKWIEALENEFNCLHDRLVNELSSGGTSVNQVLNELTKLPLKFRMEYENKIQDMLTKLEKKKVVDNLFFCLGPLFRFTDYELLQHLVSKFGSQELKLEMKSYAEKMQLFKKHITIGELINHWPGLKVPQIDHKLLRVTLADDPKSYTLEKLDFFRNRFFNELRCSEFITVSILMLVEPANSFIAVWFIPTVAVQELTEAISQIDTTFFQTEQILELSLGESTLYIAAKSVTSSSAMEPVSAITHVHVSNVFIWQQEIPYSPDQ